MSENDRDDRRRRGAARKAGARARVRAIGDNRGDANPDDDGKQAITKTGAVKGAEFGAAIAGAATGAAASAVATAAVGTTTSLTVGSAFAPFVSAIGASHVASLPAMVLFLANPLGAAIATGVLAVGGAVAGYTIAKSIAKNL